MSTILEPPSFEEAQTCYLCNCSFTTFRRRHHCRGCGRTVCADDSSQSKTLPQYGLNFLVRVCDHCYKTPNHILTPEKKPELRAGPLFGHEDWTSKPKGAALAPQEERVDPVEQAPAEPAFDCTCGMPLCICEAPAVAAAPAKTAPTVLVVPPSRPRKVVSATSASTSAALSSSGMPSLFFTGGKEQLGGSSGLSKTYEASGEGMREAVKGGDLESVKDLLAKGVDPNYRDKQGMPLLHLAAVFNMKAIVFLLMDAGASVTAKNAQGETALDCAPATLEHRMRQKLNSSNSSANQSDDQ